MCACLRRLPAPCPTPSLNLAPRPSSRQQLTLGVGLVAGHCHIGIVAARAIGSLAAVREALVRAVLQALLAAGALDVGEPDGGGGLAQLRSHTRWGGGGGQTGAGMCGRCCSIITVLCMLEVSFTWQGRRLPMVPIPAWRHATVAALSSKPFKPLTVPAASACSRVMWTVLLHGHVTCHARQLLQMYAATAQAPKTSCPRLQLQLTPLSGLRMLDEYLQVHGKRQGWADARL